MAIVAKTWISFCLLVTIFSLPSTAGLFQAWNKYELHHPLTNFRTIYHDSSRGKLYVGGVNNLYEFNSQNITEPTKILPWTPMRKIQDTCFNFKSDRMLCQNNVGVLQPVNDTHLYACGTMAYSPVCTYVEKENFTFTEVFERGRWKSPYDPYVSTVSVIANQTLFTATQDNMQGNNGIISRTLNGVTLRTQESDKYWLNDPVFVGGNHVRFRNPLHDKVMVFFREKAEEFQPYKYGLASSPNTRNVVSRVATVCVNDHGGSAWVLSRKFATYQKLTIVCTSRSDSDDAAFRYTHLQSTFELKNAQDPYNPTIFGLFTTANDAVGGTAVCAFTMNDMLRAISRNQYWDRTEQNEVLATEYEGDLIRGPGMCVPETRHLSQSRLTFAQQHPIKFGVLYPSRNTPFYHEPSIRYKHIVVHKIASENNSLSEDVTVVFMITMDGLLKRVVHSGSNPMNSWALPDIQAVTLTPNECVINFEIGEKDIFVVTNRSMTQVPLAACSLYQDCNACRLARDPYCVLDYDEECVSALRLGSIRLSALASSNVECSNFTVPTAPTSENRLIGQLQANLSFLMQQNARAMRNVADLTVDRDQKAEEHGACSEILEQRMRAEAQTDRQINEMRQNLETTQRNLSVVQTRMAKCQSGIAWYAQRIRHLTDEVNSRPSRIEFQRTIEKLRNQRSMVLLSARTCEAERDNITARASECVTALETSETRLVETNESCWRQKELEITALNAQLQTLNENVSIVHLAMSEIELQSNHTIVETNKKLGMCRWRYNHVVADSNLLKKKAKTLFLQLGEKQLLQKKQEQLIQQLKWLHKQHGHRGQQDCQHNGWFQSNATGNRFLLGKMRSNWDNARRICIGLDSKLAIFRNEEEIRYIHNVIRAFEPSRSFWIGLVKNVDGSFTWHDGTPLSSQLRSRFPESQRSRIIRRTKYCVEINPYQRWILSPCARIKRPLCQRVNTGSRTVGVVTSRSLTATGTASRSGMRTATTSYRKSTT